MEAFDSDRARVKRQSLSNEQNSAAGIWPTQQQHAGVRSNAAVVAEISDSSQHDHRNIAPRDPGPLDSSDHHCSLPDSQGDLADDLAGLCTFKSAGTGSRMRINSPSSIAKAEALLSNAMDASSSSAADVTLPYGLLWPIIPIVTVDGLALHFVEPRQVVHRASEMRGPSHSGSKRRVEE